MAKPKKFPRTDRSNPIWTDRPDLGAYALTFDDAAAIQLLAAAVDREGNQVAFARRHGVDRSHLNQILKRKRGVNETVLKALGLRKVYAPK